MTRRLNRYLFVLALAASFIAPVISYGAMKSDESAPAPSSAAQWSVPAQDVGALPDEYSVEQKLRDKYKTDKNEIEGVQPQGDAADTERLKKEETERAKKAEIPSEFEKYVRLSTGEKDIRLFGYDIFKEAPKTFAPVESVPVAPDYLLGPGDELRMTIWGKISGDYTLRIERDGKVSIPHMGVAYLAGLTFDDARAYLEKELSRYYQAAEVKMNVSMGRLRTMRVFVVGKVNYPGSYTLSSLSTIINALFAAGGPSKIGSMRDVEVKRGGATIVQFDLYDFLLKGDKTRDIMLQPEDVVFVPPAGPLTAITGSVRAPAIYELKGESSVSELIAMAGGLSDIAFRGRLKIDRIVNNNRQIVLESSLEGIRSEEVKIFPADLVQIYSVVPDRKVVRLSGAALREGEFGAGDGLTVKDLIQLAGGLKYYAYLDEAELTRVTVTPKGPVTEKVIINLKKAIEGDPANNITLQNNDYLAIKSVPEWTLYRTVRVDGEVRFPGSYTIKKGERISALIERAGGFTDRAYLKGAVFTRRSVQELQQKQLDESIARFEQELMKHSAAKISGALSPEEAKQEEISAAQQNALVSKMKAARAIGRVGISLTAPDTFKGSASDIMLEDGDVLRIPDTPAQVQVIGAVYNQTAFVYDKGYGAGNYLKKAGGFTTNADEGQIYILKIDGTAVSAREASSWGLRWDSDNNRWVSGGFMSSRLDPGDTIVVPEKLEKVAWIREMKDLTQILYQIAVTTGVLITTGVL